MSTRRATRANNNSRALSIVAGHVLNTTVSRNRPRNEMTAAHIRQLIFAHPVLFRQYFKRTLPTRTPSRAMINFWFRANTGERFRRILKNAQIQTRHRDGSVTFVLPRTSGFQGTYRLHRNGQITGNYGRIAGGQGGFMITNVSKK